MQEKNTRKGLGSIIQIVIILALCVVTISLDFFKIEYSTNALHNKYISKIIQQGVGVIAIVLLLRRMNIKLFGFPQKWLCLIPALIIAVDNFQWSAYLSGKMELVNNQPIDFILFGAYCLAVGTFEECIFRGVIFTVLAGQFSKDKDGLWKTFIVSSLIFGAAHLLNGISFLTILQVGYSFLTGGLFAFVLLKTKNIFCCGFIHALYNFCGLLFETADRMGLGNGAILDFGTMCTMFIVCALVGLFVLSSVNNYSSEEQTELYGKLGISMKKKEKSH